MKARYSGPAGAINREVARLTGRPLIAGEDYDLSADLAERLIAGSRHWERTPSTPRPRNTNPAGAPEAPLTTPSTQEETDGTS